MPKMSPSYGLPGRGMKIAHVCTEMKARTPSRFKLGNFISDLCKYQAHEGASVRTYLPRTKDMAVDEKDVISRVEVMTSFGPVHVTQVTPPEDIKASGEFSVFLVESEALFGRHNLYEQPADWMDPWAALPQAVLEHLKRTAYKPNIIHCHEWQTGLLPVYADQAAGNGDAPKIVFTPHDPNNIGNIDGNQWRRTGLPESLFTSSELEYYGRVSLLKAGMKADLVLFNSDEALGETIAKRGVEGLGGFIKAVKDSGKIFGALPKESDFYDGPGIFPISYGRSTIDAYRLLMSGDSRDLKLIDILKGRIYREVMDYVGRGMLNPSRFRISLNMNTGGQTIYRTEELRNIRDAAQLAKIEKDPDTGKFTIPRYGNLIQYLPGGNEEIFNVVSREERDEIFDPEISAEKRSSLIIEAARRLLALHTLDRTIKAVEEPLAANYVPQSIDKQLQVTSIDDSRLRERIDRAVKEGKLNAEEANHLRVIMFLFGYGHTRKIWQANEILKKINLRITFNKEGCALLDTTKEENKRKGRLVILSGPSGVGKGTICDKAKEMGAQYSQVVLYNTRDPRPGEKDGLTYHFIQANSEAIDRIRTISEEERREILKRALKVVKVNIPDNLADADLQTQKLFAEFAQEYLPVSGDGKEVFDRKAAKLAKLQTFVELVHNGKFCAISLVRKDFQAVGLEIFDIVNTQPRSFLLEVDTNLADQIVHHDSYKKIDAMAVMIVPPSANELLSRLLNRNTELPSELFGRYDNARDNLFRSKKNRVHDFYVVNDDEYRAADEFIRLAGLSPAVIKPQIWRKYNGSNVARTYYELIQQMKDSQKIFNADFSGLRLSPAAAAVEEIGKNIQAILKRRNSEQLNSPIIIEAIREYVKAHPDEQSHSNCFMGIRPGSDDPLHYGHISAGLAPILAFKLNGVVYASGASVPDKPEATAFSLRHKMTEIALKEFESWLGQSDARQAMKALTGVTNPVNGKSIVGESGQDNRALCDIAAFAWLIMMNPNVRWTYITGSDHINKYVDDNEQELVERTLKELNCPVIYLERDAYPVDVQKVRSAGWSRKLWDEGFFTKCPIPSYSGLEAKYLRRVISGKEAGVSIGDISDEINPGVLSYLRDNQIPRVYELALETAEEAKKYENYRKTPAYKARAEELRRDGLLD